MTTKEVATGVCAVLIVKKERSMVTRLGAAEKFTDSAFQSQEVQKYMKTAKVYFSTGFFLTVVPKSLVEMGKLSLEKGKVGLNHINFSFSVSCLISQHLF